ncbi:hypothetical protein HYX18_01000 [Candidatus Woesearchaeota archaeon]|nr:hypothetical protein [Candidatus Woesearchaeota archaeon]
MKHTLKVTLLILSLFFAAQIIGLFIVNKYLAVERLPFNIERPKYDERTSFLPISIAILIGTLFVLLLAKLKAVRIWKFWFFLSVLFTLVIAFGAFLNQYIALLLASILSIWKIFRPNFVVQNFTELFIYAGLAAIFVPVLNLLSVTILLFIISVYDMWAVWKSKHMIKLAQFQTDSRLFAGINLQYGYKEQNKKSTVKTAIVGGGDIAFPLLFSGVILKVFNLQNALIVSLFSAVALFALLVYSKKDKYYPAMPYITAGCFIGFFIIKLIRT